MKTHFNTLILALAIVVTAIIFAQAFKNRNRTQDTISVTGLGSKNFDSDLIVWRGYFTQRAIQLKDASTALGKDRENIKKYLSQKGISEKNIVFSSVEINKEFDYSYDNYGHRVRSVFTGYTLQQHVSIESNEVDKVEGISREVSELINLGLEFYSESPQYYYTQLSSLKIEMIAEATKDAYSRAKSIAENSDSKVGRLKNAAMGVFQITAQNSAEDYSWGGTFNTSSKRKTASITVRLEYEAEE